jgi:hypothetical protein
MYNQKFVFQNNLEEFTKMEEKHEKEMAELKVFRRKLD